MCGTPVIDREATSYHNPIGGSIINLDLSESIDALNYHSYRLISLKHGILKR